MKVLITGGSGQLGTELIRQSRGSCFEPSAPGRDELDFTEPGLMAGLVSAIRPAVVVNTAAYTLVDRAESEPGLAFAVNSRAPGELARICRLHAIPLIHISTDYVFDGRKGAPYLEDDPPLPLNIYGRSKAEGEAAVRVLERHLIIRTSWLYSAYGSNFLKTILRLSAERDELRIVADQIGSPTSAADLAGAILRMLERLRTGQELRWGTYHFCGAGTTSWFGFAVHALKVLEAYAPARRVRLVPITTPEYPTPALRPLYSVLDCSRIRDCFGIVAPPWQSSVAEAVRRLLTQADAAEQA
jgi:dTDP-4-dehydrorhamnose reductase